MKTLTIASTLFLVILPLTAMAYQPDEPDPADKKMIVRDLVFADPNAIQAKIEDLRVRETETEIRLELAADVLFAFDSAEVRPEAGAALGRALELVRGKARGAVRIEGHTDAKGTKSYNDALSLRRARSVESWMRKNGLKGVPFETRGFGAAKPIAPNVKPDGSDDADGRALNRRVEIVMRKAG